MKKVYWIVLFLNAALAVQAGEKILFEMDFEDQMTGLAGNLPGWKTHEGKVIIRQTPNGKVIGSDGVKGGEKNEIVMFKSPRPFGIKADSKIAVEFDVQVETGYGTALLGIGDAGENPPLLMGLLSADFFTRAYNNFKEQEKAVGPDGAPVMAPLKKWLTIRCELDLKADSGTMEYKMIGVWSAFKPVFFDQAQRKREFSLGLLSEKNSGVENWNGLYFRFTHVDGAIDNVRIVQL